MEEGLIRHTKSSKGGRKTAFFCLKTLKLTAHNHLELFNCHSPDGLQNLLRSDID